MMTYLINTARAGKGMLKATLRKEVICKRPTSWKTFLSGVFRINKDWAFVELPPSQMRAFFKPHLATRLHDGQLQINGDTYDVEAWNFFTLCRFCLESFQTGLIWQIRKQRW